MLRQWIDDIQLIVNQKAVLHIFGIQHSTFVVQCRCNNQAVPKGYIVLATNMKRVLIHVEVQWHDIGEGRYSLGYFGLDGAFVNAVFSG